MNNQQRRKLCFTVQYFFYYVTRRYEKTSVVHVKSGPDQPPSTVGIVRYERKGMSNGIGKWAILAEPGEMPSIRISFAT